ncbi:hypothetical protein As57867_007752, partial [Aphanomyces stellatus]
TVAAAARLEVAPGAPTGDLLHRLVEANCNEFLRKATLLVRAIFRGWNDPDAAMYLNFCSSLHLSTDFAHLCGQLGVPDPAVLLAATSPWTALVHEHAARVVARDRLPRLSYLVHGA